MTSVEYIKLQSTPLPSYSDDIYSAVKNGISVYNEYKVLECIAGIARIHLGGYNDSLLHVVKQLKDENLPLFSNDRNTLVLIRSEQQILLHYILLFEYVKELIKRPIAQAISVLSSLFDQQHAIYDYVQSIWIPLLRAESEKPYCHIDIDCQEDKDYIAKTIQLLVKLNKKGVEDENSYLS